MTMTDYSGIADNESNCPTISILSSTNATPIRVVTSTDHNLLDGARVKIVNHLVNINANGLWAVVVIASNELALFQTYGGTASIGSGTGAATGTIQGLGLLPSYQLPDDAEIGAASINNGLEDHGDRTQFIAERLGTRYIAEEFDLAISGFTVGVAPTIWFTDSVDETGWALRNHAAVRQEACASVYDDDVIEVTWTSTIDTQSTITVSGAAFAIHYALSDFGSSPNYVTASQIIGGGFVAGDQKNMITIVGRQTINIASPRLQQLSLQIKWLGFTSSLRNFNLIGDYFWSVKVWRSR